MQHGCADGATRIRPPGRAIHTANGDSAVAYIGQPKLTTSSSSTTVLRFTPAEIAQRRKENKCFHCEELFTPGHKQHCKQLFIMEVIQEDDDGG
jgi:hypothetical protein